MSKPNTILTLLQGCNSLQRLKRIHTHVIVNGLQHHPAISNKLLNFCAVSVSGSLSYAQLLFNQIQNPQTEAWNSVIRGFAQSPSPLQAILYYNYMLLVSLSRPDTFTFSFTLKACEQVKALNKCLELHGSVIRCGFETCVVVCTGLMRCYAANGLIETAGLVFDKMSERDLVSWNCMISCYSQGGIHVEALRIYERMRNENVGLDGFTLVGLLSSCADVGAFNMGVCLHRIASEMGVLGNVFVGNALIDMYAKCGDLDCALRVFNGMKKRDVLTWNSIIVGYGVNGRGDAAIAFFREMLMAGFQPNSVTFLGLLCGCSHQGLVEEGVEFFHMMISKFNLKPGIKHYGCLVDLYGRAGMLEKALEVISSSCFNNDPVLWRTLLGSCRIHKNVKMGEIAMRNLVQLRASSAGDYVLLATVYAASKDTEGVASMRKLIKSQGIKTAPGWSWIEVGDKVHRFVVDDKSHPDKEMIYLKLKEVIHRARSAGYVEEESPFALSGPSSEDCLETPSAFHSERLAIAFGLASTLEGTDLRIVKNLRVCRDCHSFTKFVSKAFKRRIIVRDRVRYHHFRYGLCSCGDYW
ncbi:pentatricopeptide repeat-containing protein At3g56550 [Mangifera indica]|uniref:pentatricopeptide repeat-containing protein At3g56550 n=1 Tax=Mangifera indica TaxID=29780 RepID=UPI001CFAE085|nr:pentatricopeptide repeat-containing protein At3g56550 [Mangifera indica]